MKILIVEDHIRTAETICKGLKEYFFQAETAHNGLDALYKISEHDFQLIILDVKLPIMNGWEVLAKIKELKPHLPVLMLSACDDVESRVRGLEAGADDYLIKPFSFDELVARIKSILRRPNQTINNKINIADLELDMARHTVFRGSQKIPLSSKEFKLLHYLMRRQGEVLTRTVLAEQVWDINFHSNTNVIDVAIKRLREKIDHGFETKLIHTIRGVGYVFEVRP